MCGRDVSMRSKPCTRTGAEMVFRIIFDHVTANHCCIRPSRSNSEHSSESVPMNMVYAQITGTKKKYERRRLAKPCDGGVEFTLLRTAELPQQCRSNR